MGKYVANHQAVPLTIVRGKGCYLYDKRGKRYLDFMGGWCTATVGWSHPEMAKAISKQAKQHFFTVASFRLAAQEELAHDLIALAPGKMERVYRCTSGSEAVEFAIKCARAATGKATIITIDEVYHGHTYGAASIGTALTDAMGPGVPGMRKLPLPKTSAEADKTLYQLEQLLKASNDIAALLTEPVWTNAGCYLPPDDFFQRVQTLCRQYNVLLIMDEVASGMGRCGRWFASELWGLTPDIITLGKSFTGGYASMGATLVTGAVYKASKRIPHYSTFGWCLTDTAATLENLRLIKEKKLVENSATIGEYLLQQLQPLTQLHKVKMVRGQGMVLAVEFAAPIAPLVALQCARRGLLVELTDSRTLFMSPPLILSRSQAKAGADILKQVCGVK